MRTVKSKLLIVCIVVGWLASLAASPAVAVTVISQSANTDITLGLPFNSLEFENPLSGTEMVQGYAILEWRDADYAAGPPRWYDDWTVNDPLGIDGNVNEIWMRQQGHSINTSTTVASTVVSIHLVGNGNDGLAQVYVDGDPVARLNMHTAAAAQTALIIVKHLPNTPHNIQVNDLGWDPSGLGTDVATLGAAALAKTKWVQPPMPIEADNLYYGWNEISDFNGPQIVADDWRCDTNDPVTDIHWWGSFEGWDDVDPPQLPTSFHITIWTDVPDPSPDDPDTFSHPDQVVWEIDCDNFSLTFDGWDYDPRTKCYETCYRFDQILEEWDFFYQEPNLAGTEPRIYWISIAANYEGVITDNLWGWKVRPHFFNDDAVQIVVPTNPHIGDQYIDGNPIHWPDPNTSWDMAFELTAHPVVESVKWEQLPVPDPLGGPCYYGWDELSYYGGQQIVADDWVCDTNDPVTDIHWWGSYQGYTGDVPPPVAPDSFHIAVWTDVPDPDPGDPATFSHPRTLVHEWIVSRSDLAETLDGCDEHPSTPGLQDSCFYYEFDIPESEWFYQDPNDDQTIYWLSISAIYTQDPNNPWGWKTRPRNPDSLAPDDAVRIFDPTDPVSGSGYISGEPIFWQTTSYDTAFVLTTKQYGEIYVKWSQPPVRYTPEAYNGWNELSFYRGTQIAADDWFCDTNDPVTDIHWWGSYIGWSCEDEPPEVPESFHIAIWTDVPPGLVPWSHPGTVIWETDCNSFTTKFVGVDIDPRDPFALPEACFKFEQDIPEDEWFYQEGPGNIYWLSIAAKYPSGTTVQYPFGWKTVPRDKQSPAPDDAVVIWEPTAPTVSDVFIDGSPIYWPDPNFSWDLAFVLTTQEEPPKEPVEHLKWSQPPLEIDPNNEIPVYCGWDEPSYLADIVGAPNVMKVVADDYRCLGTMPVTSLHWWGSYVGWLGSEPPLPQLDSWIIGFWSNVPKSTATDFSYPEELLWHVQVPADRVEVEMVGRDEFPLNPDFIPETCFQYYVDLQEDEIFRQNDFIDKTKDNVFWVSIIAVYPSPTPQIDHFWGWKTRPWHWMDDAVTFNLDAIPVPGDTLDPGIITPIEYLNESYDVAFELDTDPNWIKWEQAFTGIRRWPHYEDVNSWAVELPPESVIKYGQGPDLQEGTDVDATDDGMAATTQILADDFPCTTTGLIRDIHIWGSWYLDEPPEGDANQVAFTLSIHDDIPADPCDPASYSMPGAHRWSQPFGPGEFTVEQVPAGLQGYFNPCTNDWWQDNHLWAWKYNFDIDPSVAFHQEGSDTNPVTYWLNVQAKPLGAARFGWKTTDAQWQDFAVFGVGKDPFPGPWQPVELPTGEKLEMAFEITTKTDPVLDFNSLVADDWECERQTPVTAAVWWGSYVDYRYQPCQTAPIVRPPKPDYFLLTIWDDIPEDSNVAGSFSHPNDVIWEYKADQNDYDEVLVGFDKHPHAHDNPPREPVFRYSVRLPQDQWFRQKHVNDIYWFSVLAVFKDQEPRYPWGWTNHKHVFNDDAVTGSFDNAAGTWDWTELRDQMDESEDMSFVLFTEPGCFPSAHPDYDEWLSVGKPDCWCCPRQCHGDGDCAQEVIGKGTYWVGYNDLTVLLDNWKDILVPLNYCADFSHSSEVIGKGTYRVGYDDLTILLNNWKDILGSPPDCLDVP